MGRRTRVTAHGEKRKRTAREGSTGGPSCPPTRRGPAGGAEAHVQSRAGFSVGKMRDGEKGVSVEWRAAQKRRKDKEHVGVGAPGARAGAGGKAWPANAPGRTGKTSTTPGSPDAVQ